MQIDALRATSIEADGLVRVVNRSIFWISILVLREGFWPFSRTGSPKWTASANGSIRSVELMNYMHAILFEYLAGKLMNCSYTSSIRTCTGSRVSMGPRLRYVRQLTGSNEVPPPWQATPDKPSHPNSASGEKDSDYTPHGFGRSTIRGRGGKHVKWKNYTLLVWFLDRVG